MKPQEIRIDNMIKNGNDIGIVRSINHRNVVVYIYEKKATEEWIYSGGMTGIPLTEEWLLKLGFVKWNGEVFLIGDYDRGLTFERYDSTQATIFWRGRYLGVCQRLQFVHQLQNIYFALSCEELTINE